MKGLKIFGLGFLIIFFIRAIQVDVIEKGEHDIFTIFIIALVFAGIIGLAYSLYKDFNKNEKKEKAINSNGTYITTDGILVDDNDNDSIIIYRPIGNYMSIEDTKLVDRHELPKINNSNLILKDNEFCCFIDNAITQKTKTVTKGYQRNSNSVRVLGTSWRTGTGTSQAIREQEITNFRGTIYITNKRIIYVSQGGESFDKAIDKITAVEEGRDGVLVQIGSKTHLIILNTHVLFMQVLNLVKNKEYGMPMPEISYNPNVKYTIDSNVLRLQQK